MATHRKNGAFKVPTIPRSARDKVKKPTTHGRTYELNSYTNDPILPETSLRSEGQVEVAIPESCLDILNPDVSPGIISGPLDIGFLPDMELLDPDPLPLGVPTTEGFKQDFFEDWNPDAIAAEEDLPPRDVTDLFLLYTAGDTESSFMEEPGNPSGVDSGQPDIRFRPDIELPFRLPSTDGFTLPDTPTTEELPPKEATEDDSRQLFGNTDVAEGGSAVPTEEDTWGDLGYDREHNPDDIFGPRAHASETNQTRVIVLPLVAFDSSTSEPGSSSSSLHTLANVATDTLRAVSDCIDDIPTVVNESPSVEALQGTPHAPSPPAVMPPALNGRETEGEGMPEFFLQL